MPVPDFKMQSGVVRSIREMLQATQAEKYPSGLLTEVLRQCLSRSNGNQSRNTYLWQDVEWSQRELERVLKQSSDAARWSALELPGVPVSLKDCFDLAGTQTTLGSRFYAERNVAAAADSWVSARLRAMGAVITGKTHLHALAYGITGENRDYGDCVQPRDATLLTGGSSSGAAASVQEGSALAAIGTDTGGSVRVPAALCGLAGYRSSLGWGSWQGGGHLAQSFDTIGWLFRDLEDAPLLGRLFAAELQTRAQTTPMPPTRFAYVGPGFVEDCESEVLDSLRGCVEELSALGLAGTRMDFAWWEEAHGIFAAIQAWEAARIHRGHFEAFETPIQQRLEWGARITDEEIAGLRQRHAEFRARMEAVVAEHSLIVLPCAPVARMQAGEDHTGARARLLRYTAPASLGGMPALAVPFAAGGMQILAAHGDDARLMALATAMGRARRTAGAR